MGLQASPWRGCPIRTSPDHSLLATPRGLSQPATSFIGSWCQGIHRAPFLARRLDLSNAPSRQDQRSHKKEKSLHIRSAHPRQAAERLSICLLNYSSVLQVLTRGGHKKGPTSVEPQWPAGGVVKSTYAIEDSNLRMTCVSSSQSRCATLGQRPVRRPAKIHYIPPPSRRATVKFRVLTGSPCEAWSRGDSNP
jgi:hypothetical protein